jgi:hypothetical protein
MLHVWQPTGGNLGEIDHWRQQTRFWSFIWKLENEKENKKRKRFRAAIFIGPQFAGRATRPNTFICAALFLRTVAIGGQPARKRPGTAALPKPPVRLFRKNMVSVPLAAGRACFRVVFAGQVLRTTHNKALPSNFPTCGG